MSTEQKAPAAPASNGNGNGKQSAAMVVGPQARVKTIQTSVTKAWTSLAPLLPKGLDAGRFLRIITGAVARTPELADCTPVSVVLAAAQAASLGLEPNTPLGLSYLVPFKNKKRAGRIEAQFIPGYRGLARLAYNSGEIVLIYSHTVWELDEFGYQLGTEKKLMHTPSRSADRGSIIGFYNVAKFRTGEVDFEFMWKHEVDAIRNRSASGNDGPWVTDYEEMGQKTVLRRHAKSLPLSEEKLGRALQHQAVAESGTGPDYADVADAELVLDAAMDDDDTQAQPADRGAALASKLQSS